MLPTRRASLRLPYFDYACSAGYYVTICTHRKECILGNIRDGVPELSRVGEIIAEEWLRTATLRPYIELDEYVVMPNHLHGIVLIGLGDAAAPGVPLGRIIGHFKTSSARRVNELRHTAGQAVWQRGFYDRVIRNEREMQRIRQYIVENPMRWRDDPEYR